MKKIVVLSGAGISAESGLKTFRDEGGLWEEYKIEEIATPEAWQNNPSLVLEFYNKRRKEAMDARPNGAHIELANLEDHYAVEIITQNIDNLHERAGSSKVLHLHGEIMKAQSSYDSSLVYDLSSWELKAGQQCELGYQLRPNVVWFGEPVPKMAQAASITESAEILIIIGTSLNVYPAAGLIDLADHNIPKYLVDPNEPNMSGINNLTHIKENASTGVPKLAKLLLGT